MTKTFASILSASMFAASAAPAVAQSQGDWTLGLGITHIETKDDNGSLLGGNGKVLNDQSFTFTFEYFVRDNIGIELLAAAPFQHDIGLDGSGVIGDTKHLPPTLSINYHVPTDSAWKPYIGAGLNYTYFFDEDSAAGDLELDDSWGFAVQAGIDYMFTENNGFRANVRYIDIDSDATLDGADIGTAKIDPILIGFSYIHRF